MQIDNSSDLILILSLINLGFFGGFSHCASMCGPIVVSQISIRLKNSELKDFSGLKKIRGLALSPYHFGRITTYSIIGFFISFLSKNIRDFSGFNKLSGILLFLASLFFFKKVFEGTKFAIFLTKFEFFNKTSFIFDKIKKILKPQFLEKLFSNPTGFNGYLLGIILGFIPCGLLYGAFIISAAIENPILAGLAMFLFGISTIPALFGVGFGGFYLLKSIRNSFNLISRLVILINSVTIFVMSLSLLIN